MSWTCSCGGENASDARFCNQCGAPRPTEPAVAEAPTAPPEPAPPQGSPSPASSLGEGAAQAGESPPAAPPASPKRKSRAPLIIAIIAVLALLGVCVLGIVAAIAIPNFLSAAQRAKQKRAMAEMQAVAAACQSYATDNGRFPDTGHGGDSFYSTVEATALAPFLVPNYLPQLPQKDPWEHPYLYGVSADGGEFILICPGADGITKLDAIPKEHVATHCFEDDIVWEDSGFIQSPEGPQKRCG